ncbi:MAG: hypothetical protein A2157_00725 [Deltaproteobacteria bacterium RBG_16_47_11]|nr:MAG: hypothetical protein A2157_00725 [Deltaproteobacteria bacterium RBG_16_47_11]
MEAIHLKTVDPVSQNLFRSAAKHGVRLLWERYERLQPQDGFLRLGLSCPYGCMQGPCRIDPFGRGSEQGLCGLDRDGMVAAFLLRLCLHGVLETMNERGAGDTLSEKSWPHGLTKRFSKALKHLGNKPLSLREIDRSALLLQRPSESAEVLVEQALRLGILTLLLSERKAPSRKTQKRFDCQVGYGLLSEEKIFIGVAGQPAQKAIESLVRETSRGSASPYRILSLGDWIQTEKGFLPFACSSGEAELLLSTGSIHLLLAGPKTDPSLSELCKQMEIPVVMSEKMVPVKEILSLARHHFSTHSQHKTISEPSFIGQSSVAMTIEELKPLLKKRSIKKVALIGGSDTPQQPMGWLPVELATALLGRNYLVAGWGDAVLWMIKNGLASEDRESRAIPLDEQQSPILALKGLSDARRIGYLRGICFTGLKTCRDLTVALGLAGLGMDVCVASPLPLWGSEKVRNLLSERFADVGGTMTHYDHPANPEEILEWFLR